MEKRYRNKIIIIIIIIIMSAYFIPCKEITTNFLLLSLLKYYYVPFCDREWNTPSAISKHPQICKRFPFLTPSALRVVMYLLIQIYVYIFMPFFLQLICSYSFQ